MSERSRIGYATQQVHSQIVGVDGCRTINQLTRLIAIVERLSQGVDVIG
jgi:hypothetical protein